MVGEIGQPAADDHHVQCQVHRDQYDRETDHLVEAFQKHTTQQHQQEHRQQRLPLQPIGHVVPERVVDQVFGGISGRECLGDDVVGCREAQQREHQELAGPAVNQLLQHRNRTLPVKRLPRHVAIDRQRSE